MNVNKRELTDLNPTVINILSNTHSGISSNKLLHISLSGHICCEKWALWILQIKNLIDMHLIRSNIYQVQGFRRTETSSSLVIVIRTVSVTFRRAIPVSHRMSQFRFMVLFRCTRHLCIDYIFIHIFCHMNYSLAWGVCSTKNNKVIISTTWRVEVPMFLQILDRF